MSTFRFHSWTVVEIETDDGIVGLRQRGAGAARSPRPSSTSTWRRWSIGQDPWDYEYLWQRMYRATHAWGRKGVTMAAISAVDLAIWDILGKSRRTSRCSSCWAGAPRKRSPATTPSSTAPTSKEMQAEAQKYLDQGFTAFKMRFGYGPAHGRRAWRRT